MPVYKGLINLHHFDCVKHCVAGTHEGTGTSHLKSIFADETIAFLMTLKRYHVTNHSNKSWFSNSPTTSVLMQVNSSEITICDRISFLKPIKSRHQFRNIRTVSGHIKTALATYSTLKYALPSVM